MLKVVKVIQKEPKMLVAQALLYLVIPQKWYSQVSTKGAIFSDILPLPDIKLADVMKVLQVLLL